MRCGITDQVAVVLGTTKAVLSILCRAATLFGVEAHVRVVAALTALGDGQPERLGALMEASQDGYDAMGLGDARAATIREALARPAVFGARSSGGSCGGAVVGLCAHGALDDVDGLIR